MKTIRKKTTGYKVENLKEDITQDVLDNLPEGSGGSGGSVSSPYIIEISVEDGTDLYTREATAEEIEQITNNPFNVVFKYIDASIGSSSVYLYHSTSDTTTQQIGYSAYIIAANDGTTYVDNIVALLQSGSLIVAVRQRTTL